MVSFVSIAYDWISVVIYGTAVVGGDDAMDAVSEATAAMAKNVAYVASMAALEAMNNGN